MTSPTLLPLGERPTLVNLGPAEHGRFGQEEYLLPRLWCMHLYFYEVEVEVAGHTIQVIPGAITLIPPNSRIVYKFPKKRHRHFFVHFGVRPTEPLVEVPLIQHVPDGQDEILDRLQNIHRLHPRNPLHAETLFWGLLWDLAEAGRREPTRRGRSDQLLEAIDTYIEEHIGEKITATVLARHLGLTPTHVNRVVQERERMTTVQLIRKRRLQRAYRLLLHSTMSIKSIAAECGITDLQQFNKLMRSSYGRGPRQLRAQLPEGEPPTWALDRE